MDNYRLHCRRDLRIFSEILCLNQQFIAQAFVAQHVERVGEPDFTSVLKDLMRLTAKAPPGYQQACTSRAEAMPLAYLLTAFTMIEISRHFKLGYQTVSRAIPKFDGGG